MATKKAQNIHSAAETKSLTETESCPCTAADCCRKDLKNNSGNERYSTNALKLRFPLFSVYVHLLDETYPVLWF